MVYQAGRKYHKDDYLVDYAARYNTVEVDQWFWSLFPGDAGPKLPDPQTVETYLLSVPSDFEFTVKAPNALTLTHFYGKQPPNYRDWANRPNPHLFSERLVDQFLHTLRPLLPRVAMVMLQFEYLNRSKAPSRSAFVEALSGFLEKLPGDTRWGVEIRNGEFLTAEYFAMLRHHNVSHVYLDGYHMPSAAKVLANNADSVTNDRVVLRLHGPDRAGIEKLTNKKWHQIVAPQDRGVDHAARMVNHLASQNIKVYVNVNNHYEGSAPLTIERLARALAELS